MASPEQSGRGPRNRARIACGHCHSRKVKCDLQKQQGAICSNCQKYDLCCDRRASVKAKYAAVPKMAPQPPSSGHSNTADSIEYGGGATMAAASPEQLHGQYLGEMEGVLRQPPVLPDGHLSTTAFSRSMNQAILHVTGADVTPPEILLTACFDTFRKHLYHRFPVVDEDDLTTETPSLALQQVMCMMGAMLRHPRGPDALVDNEKFYYKAKTLIHTSHEQDPITILKVLCLLSTRNIIGPVVLTADCAWHWIGLAVRLLHQTGLHREVICSRMPRPGTVRRIAWCFFIQDKLVSAGLGRPTALKDAEFDVNFLQPGDFEVHDTQALLFRKLADLSCILSRVLDLRQGQKVCPQNNRDEILVSLQKWIEDLPTELRLFDNQERRWYRGDVYEVHIIYFAVVITYLNLYYSHDIYSAHNIAALVASSCMARLYNELYHRDDINYLLGIHMWLFTVAAIPQLLHIAAETASTAACMCFEELDILVCALEQFKIKIPGAIVVLNAIERRRNSQVQARSQSSVSEAIEQDQPAPDTLHNITVLRTLFPFSNLLSPRLTLLDQAVVEPLSSELGSSLVNMPVDIGWIFDEESDLSSIYPPFDWPGMFSPVY